MESGTVSEAYMMTESGETTHGQRWLFAWKDCVEDRESRECADVGWGMCAGAAAWPPSRWEEEVHKAKTFGETCFSESKEPMTRRQ